MEQTNFSQLWDDKKSIFSQSDAIIQYQFSGMLCPSRRTSPALSIDSDGRDKAPNRPGACADYGVVIGDGSPDDDRTNDFFQGKPTIFDPPPNGAFQHANNAGKGRVEGCKTEPGKKFPFMAYNGMDEVVSLRMISDGTSNTLFQGEKHVAPRFQSYAVFDDGTTKVTSLDNCVYNQDDARTSGRCAGPTRPLVSSPNDESAIAHRSFGSSHAGGIVNFLRGDGSVAALNTSIDPLALGYLANIRDGQVVNTDGL